MKMVKKIIFCKIYYSLFFLQFVVTGCFRPSIGPCQFGSVKDSVHNLPLQNVEVLMEVGYDCFNPLCFPAGDCSYSLTDRKRYTDDEGKFFFAPQIHMAEHWICWSTKDIEYSKPGYCTLEDRSSWFYKNVHLDLWTHCLDSLYYNESLRCIMPLTSGQLDQLGFVTVDEKGVFYRRPGSCFTKIFYGESFFDETSNTWITLDKRGLEFVPNFKPPGNLGKIISKNGRLFSNGEKIFIWNMNKEVKTIIPHKGNISYIYHDSIGWPRPGWPLSDFYTIEGDGSMICHYGSSRDLFHLYNTELDKQNLYDIRFFKVYDSSVLSSNSGGIKEPSDLSIERRNINSSHDLTQFIKIEKLDSRKFLLLTKTPLNWHIYQMEWLWKGNSEKYQLEFTELASFSAKREILAFTTARYNGSLFISFKNEGIRNFTIGNDKLLENEIFYQRSQSVITSDITEISTGYPHICAISGEDKIYRFSYDGWPDCPIQLKPGLKQALNVSHKFLYEETTQIKYTNGLDTVSDYQTSDSQESEFIEPPIQEIIYLPEKINKSLPNSRVTSPSKTKSEK